MMDRMESNSAARGEPLRQVPSQPAWIGPCRMLSELITGVTEIFTRPQPSRHGDGQTVAVAILETADELDGGTRMDFGLVCVGWARGDDPGGTRRRPTARSPEMLPDRPRTGRKVIIE